MFTSHATGPADQQTTIDLLRTDFIAEFSELEVQFADDLRLTEWEKPLKWLITYIIGPPRMARMS